MQAIRESERRKRKSNTKEKERKKERKKEKTMKQGELKDNWSVCVCVCVCVWVRERERADMPRNIESKLEQEGNFEKNPFDLNPFNYSSPPKTNSTLKDGFWLQHCAKRLCYLKSCLQTQACILMRRLTVLSLPLIKGSLGRCLRKPIDKKCRHKMRMVSQSDWQVKWRHFSFHLLSPPSGWPDWVIFWQLGYFWKRFSSPKMWWQFELHFAEAIFFFIFT